MTMVPPCSSLAAWLQVEWCAGKAQQAPSLVQAQRGFMCSPRLRVAQRMCGIQCSNSTGRYPLFQVS